ncbi:STAS domain-containing protein [Streptomyces sp. NPDC006430]|uniref:STAS domain-containing protein n=1 Tax=Streptomyces sp. NPDC006430 TaxID=3154299 RepID=UPI0033AD3F13
MTTQLIALTRAVHEDGPVALHGELDFHTSSQIGPRLVQLAGSWGPELTLDLSGLTFCDSSGIDLFVRIHRQCAVSGTRLRLVNVPSLIAESMRALGDDRVLLSSGK